jgi:hypothetical protein
MDRSQQFEDKAQQPGIPLVAQPTHVNEEALEDPQPTTVNKESPEHPQPTTLNESNTLNEGARPQEPIIIFEEIIHATRLERLTRKAVPVDCPYCGVRRRSVVSGKSNRKTQ